MLPPLMLPRKKIHPTTVAKLGISAMAETMAEAAFEHVKCHVSSKTSQENSQSGKSLRASFFFFSPPSCMGMCCLLADIVQVREIRKGMFTPRLS